MTRNRPNEHTYKSLNLVMSRQNVGCCCFFNNKKRGEKQCIV